MFLSEPPEVSSQWVRRSEVPRESAGDLHVLVEGVLVHDRDHRGLVLLVLGAALHVRPARHAGLALVPGPLGLLLAARRPEKAPSGFNEQNILKQTEK